MVEFPRPSLINGEHHALETYERRESDEFEFWNEFDNEHNEGLQTDATNLTYLETQLDEIYQDVEQADDANLTYLETKLDEIDQDVEQTDDAAEMVHEPQTLGMSIYDNAQNYLLEHWDNFDGV